MSTNLRPLSEADILRWADAYHQATGQWPTMKTPGLAGSQWETWSQIDRALRRGLRQMTGGSSLAQLLAERRGVRNMGRLPLLTEDQILAWADAHYQRTGQWPTKNSGLIPDTGRDKWQSVDSALRQGLRNLPGGSSLARLLEERRGVRNLHELPPLTETQILAWADAHLQRTGTWPTKQSGPVADTAGEKWAAVDSALFKGRRQLPGGSSLAQLLDGERGVPNRGDRPRLTRAQILAWADAHHNRTGQWPNVKSGPIAEAAGENWLAVNHALLRCLRGLTGKTTLARLIAEERGVRNRASLPRLHLKRILAWADAHKQRTGDWPTAHSGPIFEAPLDTWLAVDHALRNGLRKLRGGSSLARLLAERRGRRNLQDLPRLTVKQIVAWADAHFQRTGTWPSADSGPIVDAPEENWHAVDEALQTGARGLTLRTTLLRLLARKRGVRHVMEPPSLTVAQILGWADAYYQRRRMWPGAMSGPIEEAPGETWLAVNSALRDGRRGLAGGSSLARLLAKYRGKRGQPQKPGLTQAEILDWADAYHQRRGAWPRKDSGPIGEAPGLTWLAVDAALRQGSRGFPGGSSLARLLTERSCPETADQESLQRKLN